MEGILGANNLNVIYNKGTSAESIALHNVTFYARPEEFIVVYGPSGCGKSTLLYTLTGVERHIDSGEVWLCNRDIANIGHSDLLALHRRSVGMIFQAYNLIGTLNVLQNVTLPLLASGRSKSERIGCAESLLERFGIAHLARRYPNQLSGGQQQRVAIARALVTGPDVLVADEPTGNLDSQSAEIVLRELLELNRKDKKTILLVTHDPAYLAYAHRILHMKDGSIVRIEERGRDGESMGVRIQESVSADPALGVSPFDTLRTNGLSFEELSRVERMSQFARLFAKDRPPLLVDRLAHVLAEMVLGRLSKKDAYNVLARSPVEGGSGYTGQEVNDLFLEIDELLDLRRWMLSLPPSERTDIPASLHIARWFLGERFGTISSAQLARFGEAIRSAISRSTDEQTFNDVTRGSPEHGGVGLPRADAERFANRLKLIADIIPDAQATVTRELSES